MAQQIIIEVMDGKVTNVFGDGIEYIVCNNDTDDPIDWDNPIMADPRAAFLLDEVPAKLQEL